MGMAVTNFTADMVRALPDDGNRYEVVHGELLVTPAPRLWHQEIVLRIARALLDYTRETGHGHVLHSPADISWNPHMLVQPDVFVVPLSEARTLDWAQVRTLLLAVEVLSPSTARADRFTKRRLYQEVGIPTYWAVDPDNASVEIWTPDAIMPTRERQTLPWQPAGVAEPLTIELGELFRAI
jgi:Uma2 family endonuclease